jgi:DNA-binding transcriptional ArsR family regulator
MEFEVDVAAVAAVLANRARMSMLELLLDGAAHPAGELARQAGVAVSTASGHLSALAQAGLVDVQRNGRQRQYRLSGSEVASALEALAAVAPRRPVTSLRAASAAARLRAGRTCYDHIAGRLGLIVTDGLVARGALIAEEEAFTLTASGARLIESIGVDVTGARGQKRGFALACLDWSERRFHLAGALGSATCARLFDLRWIRRSGRGRAIALTDQGSEGLRTLLGIDIEQV